MTEGWWTRAECTKPGVSPDWWHAEAGEHTWRVARWYCARCPVRSECLIETIKRRDKDFGIRAGLNVQERKQLIRMVDAARSMQAGAA